MSGIKQRNYGIDLLRITSMFMVVILHVIGQGGMMSSTSGMTISYEITRFVWTAAYCAVNCYALISGYVGCNSTFKLSNLIKLWIQVMFTCVTITAIFAIYNPSTVSFQSWINAFFPVMRKQFWYFTSYFCIFLITPFKYSIYVYKICATKIQITSKYSRFYHIYINQNQRYRLIQKDKT